MYILIDISEYSYETIIENGEVCRAGIEKLIAAIQDGISLDTITNEIKEHRNKVATLDKYDLIGDCLDIIDKYKREAAQ